MKRMSGSVRQTDRRTFLTAGGLALGAALGLGLRPAEAGADSGSLRAGVARHVRHRARAV